MIIDPARRPARETIAALLLAAATTVTAIGHGRGILCSPGNRLRVPRIATGTTGTFA